MDKQKLETEIVDHMAEIRELGRKMQNDLHKSRRKAGIDLIFNDYHVRAQKHLYAIGLDVEWFKQHYTSKVSAFKNKLPD